MAPPVVEPPLSMSMARVHFTPFRLPLAAVALLALATSALAAAADGAASAARAVAVPVYRAVPAPAARLRYEVTHGPIAGNGHILWKPAGTRYEARLEAFVAGIAVLTETSQGQLGARGLQPLSYTDQRLGRSLQEARFERDRGRLTYAGSSATHPLTEGAQDRLSWMLQIGAVLNAEPQHAAPGGRLAFFITGARGDAEVWAFRYAGTESVQAPGGPIRAVKFTREPREPRDKIAEIWLAPLHQHLPVRARFSTRRNGDVFELLLRDIGAP
jgi:hypothetical protein